MIVHSLEHLLFYIVQCNDSRSALREGAAQHLVEDGAEQAQQHANRVEVCLRDAVARNIAIKIYCRYVLKILPRACYALCEMLSSSLPITAPARLNIPDDERLRLA